MQNQVIRKSIKYTIKTILDLPNIEDTKTIMLLIKSLNELLHYKVEIPPFAEVMTVLKHEKPILYHKTRLNLTKTSHLHNLFQIDMNISLAKKRLDDFHKLSR